MCATFYDEFPSFLHRSFYLSSLVCYAALFFCSKQYMLYSNSINNDRIVDNGECADAVDREMVQCLSNTSTVLVQCPVGYSLQLVATAVYKSPSSGCPSTPVTDTACWHSNVTADSLRTNCSSDYRCLLTLPAITSALHCSTTAYPGDYFAIVHYYCEPRRPYNFAIIDTIITTSKWPKAVRSTSMVLISRGTR